MFIRWKHTPTTNEWFLLASMLLALFLIYTAIFSTGVLLNLTLQQVQWLLHRPLTGVDCVFFEWKKLGEVPFSLFFTLTLGIGCLCLGYRRRVLPYVLLLFLLGVGVEVIGKQLFTQPIPPSLGFGMSSLSCPQIQRQSRSVQLMVMLGMWWEAPSIPPKRLRNAQYGATTPFTLEDTKDASLDHSYPSGHAIRWNFIGLIACWLAWRHTRRRVLRWLLMALALAVAFGGGFAQFYIGVHLTNDVIAGYLLGASSACCAIGLLQRDETRTRKKQPPEPLTDVDLTLISRA